MMLRHCGKGDHITRLVLAACRHTSCHSITEASSFQQLQVYVKHFHSPWQENLLALYSSSCYPLSQVVVSHNNREKNIISRLAFLVQPKGIAMALTPHQTHPLQDTGSHWHQAAALVFLASSRCSTKATTGAMSTIQAMNTVLEKTGSKLRVTLGTHLGHAEWTMLPPHPWAQSPWGL